MKNEKSVTMAELEARIVALETKIIELSTRKERSRGPESTRSMTEDDAKRIMIGDLKDKRIGECAKELGLSYGQIYSARGGYTFKTQYAAKQAEIKAAIKPVAVKQS